MNEYMLRLTEGEWHLLNRLLDTAFTDQRVVVRRTEFSDDLREQMEAEEAMLRSLKEKMQHAGAHHTHTT